MSRTPNPLFEMFSTLKGYVNQLSAGERTPSEVGSALNDWARDSAESIKAKISEEVESTVAKMGFIKRDEFEALQRRLEKLESDLHILSSKNGESVDVKKPVRRVLKKTVKATKAKVGK